MQACHSVAEAVGPQREVIAFDAEVFKVGAASNGCACAEEWQALRRHDSRAERIGERLLQLKQQRIDGEGRRELA